MTVAVEAKLATDPRRLNTRSGIPTVIASVALPCGDSAPPLWLRLVGRRALADRLDAFGRGDQVHALGHLERHCYLDRHAQPQDVLELVLDDLVGTEVRGGRLPARSAEHESREPRDEI